MSSQNKLEITLPSDTEILLTRNFDAPRELVWDCFTDPALIRRWLGAGSMSVCEVDATVGGAWRVVFVAPHGAAVPLKGEFLEIDRPSYFLRTVCYDVPPRDNYYWTERADFTELDGGTQLTSLLKHSSKEARDGQLRGLEGGAESSYNALERLLEWLQSATLARRQS